MVTEDKKKYWSSIAFDNQVMIGVTNGAILTCWQLSFM